MLKIRKKTKNILLLLAWILILFIIFEFSLRLFYPQPIFKHTVIESSPQIFNESNYLPWQLKPLTEARHMSTTDEFNVLINTNSLGYRDYEFNINKPEDIYRILVVGDSFTYGFGVEINETYVKNLEKFLNEKEDKKYSIINAGFKSGRSPDTEYLFLKKEGLLLDPDMIIIGFFIGNDFSDYRGNIWELNNTGDINKIKSKEDYIDSKNRLRSIENSSQISTREILYKINVFLSFNSHLYVLFKNSFRNVLNLINSGKPESNIYSLNHSKTVKKDIETTLDLILRMKKIAYENNIKFVVILIPTKEQVYNYKIKDKENNLLNWTKPNDILINFGIKNNITIINLLPYLREHVKSNKEDIYFKVDPHLNKKGNYVIGRLLYKELNSKYL